MSNKETRKRYDFFTLKYYFKGQETYDLSRLSTYLEDVYAEFEKEKTGEESEKEWKPIECANQLFVGISDIEKIPVSDETREDFYWLIHFSKVDTEKNSSVGNVNKDIVKGRKDYASSEDEGPITDTVVIINTFNNIIIIPTNRDGFGQNLLKQYLYKTVKQKGAEISILVDAASYNKATLMDSPHQIELNISKIADIEQISNPDTSAKKAQDLLLSAESDKMYLKLVSDNKFQGALESIVSSFKTFLDDDRLATSTLRITGEHDHEPQIIDLVNKRVVFIDEHVKLDNDGKLTVSSMKNSIKAAYTSRRRQLDLYGATVDILKERESDKGEETN